MSLPIRLLLLLLHRYLLLPLAQIVRVLLFSLLLPFDQWKTICTNLDLIRLLLLLGRLRLLNLLSFLMILLLGRRRWRGKLLRLRELRLLLLLLDGDGLRWCHPLMLTEYHLLLRLELRLLILLLRWSKGLIKLLVLLYRLVELWVLPDW